MKPICYLCGEDNCFCALSVPMPKDLLLKSEALKAITCPNCQKPHPLARMAARVTCVCNFVFDPREKK